MKSIRISNRRVLSSAKYLHFDIPWKAYSSTLGTICRRFWLRERSQRSMESLVEGYIASCCFLHSEYYLSLHAVQVFFRSLIFCSCPPTWHVKGWRIKNFGSPAWSRTYWECKERSHCTTHRDLWSPESHLDSCAQHPQYLLTPSGWMYVGLLFIFTKIKRAFQFWDGNYRKLLKTSTVASSCRNSWRCHYPLPPPPAPSKKQLTAKPPISWKSGLLGQCLKFIMVNYTKSSCLPWI